LKLDPMIPAVAWEASDARVADHAERSGGRTDVTVSIAESRSDSGAPDTGDCHDLGGYSRQAAAHVMTWYQRRRVTYKGRWHYAPEQSADRAGLARATEDALSGRHRDMR
jgi:hypothetical protein